MEIFKFGGASLQNAAAIKQLGKIISEYQGNKLVVVVSAMGKITQALEGIFWKYLHNQPYNTAIEEVYLFHADIIQPLLGKTYPELEEELDTWKKKLIQDLDITYLPEDIEKLYSKVVAWGEILSSRIIYYYLAHIGIDFNWIDARDYIKTKFGFMDAELDESRTRDLIQSEFKPILAQNKFLITQGFIGSDRDGFTTTLGKEGSDFTGAILAGALEATSLTIWKDVPGVMSADPKTFKHAIKFEELSYATMAQMSFYGAQVIHPKTIYPIAMQNIPLYIRPFYDSQSQGTLVNSRTQIEIAVPIYIVRQDQILIKVNLGNFIFINEKHLSILYEELATLALRINFLERTPYYLSICLNNTPIKIEKLLSALQVQGGFKIDCSLSVHLLTVIGRVQEADLNFIKEKTILAKNYSSLIYQLVFLNKGLDSY